MTLYKLTYLIGNKTKTEYCSSSELSSFIASSGVINIKKVYIQIPKHFLLRLTEKMQLFINKSYSLEDTFKLCQQLSQNAFEKMIFGQMLKTIEKGGHISSFMDNYKGLFPRYAIEIIRFSEKSNNLSKGFSIIHKFLSFIATTKNALIKELIYPAIVFIMGILSFFAIMVFIIPNYKEIYTTVLQEIPKGINFLFVFSSFIRNNFFLLTLLFILLIGLAIVIYMKYKQQVISLFLSIPIIKSINLVFIKLQFCYFLKEIILENYSIDNAINLLKGVFSSSAAKNLLNTIEKGIKNGLSFYKTVIESKFFNNYELDVLSIGDSANYFAESLNMIITYNEQKLEKFVMYSKNIVQPLIFIIVGIFVVLLVLLSMYPILSLLDKL